MKKIFFILILFLTSCGYTPLYENKVSNNYIFSQIETFGIKEINRRIISMLSFKKDPKNFNFTTLILKNNKNIIETSKDSKGKAESYKMIIEISIIIKKNDNIFKQITLSEEFSYKNLDNKFDLSQYEKNIENNILDKISEKIIIYLNLK